MFVREADLAYPLGPAAARPYLDYAVLERALIETGADAAWPGWGFVAEDPAFAELCEKIGVAFIGPDAEAMRKLGDKIGAKLIAEEVGVPVAPWSRGAVATLDDALAAADRIGYPLMLKATAGGGGRGIRVITSPGDLTEAFERTSAEALRAFGSGTVFLERLVTGARHVEVQVIADGQGTAWALGVRDCSVQRRNQKIIEESASPVLAPEQVAELKASAERLARAVGYRGAATVEFLYHPGEKRFAFLEVNTRLQVEHPITELTTGIDLVRLQLHVAGGGRLEGDRPRRVRARHRGAAERRGPGPRLRARAWPHRPAGAARGPGHPRRYRGQRGRHHPGRLRLDDREDHRLRSRPGRGARPAAPRDGRDHRDHRGRRHQQELRARPARPARGDRRQRRHRLDRPGPGAGPPRRAQALRASRWPRPRSRPTRTRRRSAGSGC